MRKISRELRHVGEEAMEQGDAIHEHGRKGHVADFRKHRECIIKGIGGDPHEVETGGGAGFIQIARAKRNDQKAERAHGIGPNYVSLGAFFHEQFSRIQEVLVESLETVV